MLKIKNFLKLAIFTDSMLLPVNWLETVFQVHPLNIGRLSKVKSTTVLTIEQSKATIKLQWNYYLSLAISQTYISLDL